jgi:2-polyprenyl-3-methyl-5-hydroxy-6-metoxy-1,4-benzoquinol methylase
MPKPGSVKALDRVLQRWRIAKAAPHIRLGARVLDVGCADGELFRRLRRRIAGGVGIDPALVTADGADGAVRLIRGRFPDDLPTDERFDAITMLAVFEHLSDEDQRRAIDACAHLLSPHGRVVLTVPEPVVDRIVHLLARVGLLAGMAMHEHHGFVARLTRPLFERAGFVLDRHERFQLGMNNLFVFSRRSERARSPSTDG